MGQKKTKLTKSPLLAMTFMTACIASVGWDPMNAQLTFLLSSQFSPYKAQLNKMLKMHFFLVK